MSPNPNSLSENNPNWMARQFFGQIFTPDQLTQNFHHQYFDLRTYSLKPGSLYDWSNYWSKGIQFRSSVRQDVPYCGLFTQLGQLHTIYHIWWEKTYETSILELVLISTLLWRCYKSMADRKQCREATWHYPEWNDIVANTVPLVNTMSTTILEPLEFSPTQ